MTLYQFLYNGQFLFTGSFYRCQYAKPKTLENLKVTQDHQKWHGPMDCVRLADSASQYLWHTLLRFQHTATFWSEIILLIDYSCLKVHSTQNQPQNLFSCPKSIYFCHLSVTSCTLVKLQLREHGTNLYRDAGEFDGHCRKNLEIWNQLLPWLRHGTADNTA